MLDLQKIASVLAMQEGFFKQGTVPQTHNNPDDLRDYKTQKIAQYGSLGEGLAWDILQIALDIRRGLSLRKLVWNWAPPNENNSQAYFDFVASKFPEIDPDAPLWNYYEIGQV